MKTRTLPLLCMVALFATGCASVNVKDNLMTLDDDYFSEGSNKVAIVSEGENKKLKAAYQHVMGTLKSLDGKKSTSETLQEEQHVASPLPSYLANEPLIKRIVIAAHGALVERSDTALDMTKDDISSMTRMLNHNFGANKSGDLSKSSITDADAEKSSHKRLQSYLIAYYSDDKNGFVNREGTVYKRPEIKNSVGNDVITAVIAISVESLFDSLLHTPVYVIGEGEKAIHQTISNKAPTFDVFQIKKCTDSKKTPCSEYRVQIVEQGVTGIDKHELKAIRYLSGLAGDQSKMLSGAVYRAIGGVDIGFVILGKFSFGDNDTLAKMLDTTFEIASKRIVEEGAYRGFKKVDFSRPEQVPSKGKEVLPGTASSKARLLINAMD